MTYRIDYDPHAGGSPSRVSTSKTKRGWRIFLRDILLIFLAALLISFLIKTFLIRSFYIPSSSMVNTLHVGDRINVNQLEPRLVPMEHGDVVVFRDPGGWLHSAPTNEPEGITAAVDAALAFVGVSPSDSNDHLIKRVIGLPGDTVVCCNDFGQLTVNGVPLEEPYITLSSGSTKAAPEDFSVTVPAGKLWVMGDNRYNSEDSAAHYAQGDPGSGFVPIDNVVGRALLISWPVSRWSWLDNYPVTFRGTDSSR